MGIVMKWAGKENHEANQMLKTITATGEGCIALVGGSDLFGMMGLCVTGIDLIDLRRDEQGATDCSHNGFSHSNIC